jgi:ATP-dependent protease ClpP protease subunit
MPLLINGGFFMPQANTWYEIRAKADSVAEVLIYGDIGASWFGESVTALDLVKSLSEVTAGTIEVRINSFGGSVTDGIAIYNALKRHAATVNVHIDGVAFSIASLIAMAGDTVNMAVNARLMIHAPWAGVAGNSADLRQFADQLDSFAVAMSHSYIAKTGKSREDVLALLTDGVDHYYDAEQALAAGFVDQITEVAPVLAQHDFAAISARYQSFSNAAAAAKLKEQTMPEPIIPAAKDPAAILDIAAIQAAAVQAEVGRRADIAVAFAAFGGREGVVALLGECQNDVSCTVPQAKEKLLAHLGRDAQPVAGHCHIEVGASAFDKFKVGAEAALMAKAGLQSDDTANQFRSYSLLDMAREVLAHHRVATTGMSKMDVVAAAFTSSSDFAYLLQNVAQKAMMKGYDEAEETFQRWTSVGSLPDFKAAKRVDIGSFPSLDKVVDGAEYKYAEIGDRGETVQLATYGKLFGITRQTIINDDLAAFTRIPRKMGRAAIRTVGDLVYALLTSGQTMSDSKTLFHADHGNLPTGALINTVSVDAMRVAMALQKDGAAVTGIRLSKLIVPVALEGTARVVQNSEFEVGASSKNNTVPNMVRGLFEVISDPRLDAASSAVWYGAADANMHDVIEVSYLDGQQAPVLEQQDGWSRDGVEFKVRIDAGVRALDWRGLAKNVGS